MVGAEGGVSVCLSACLPAECQLSGGGGANAPQPMKVSKTLADIASNTPSLLNGLVTTEFSTAREAMIRMACSQSPALEDLAPALFHASTAPNAHILYGGSLDPPFDDVEYAKGNAPEMVAAAESIYCIGSGMVEVCKSTSRPAILYAYKRTEGLTVRMVVHDCPLASMEVELFHGSPTAFERAWLGEGCKAQRALRERVHQWMLSRGNDHFPSFLINRDQSYHTVRRGVLPFLRLRAPEDESEEATLNRVLEGLQPPNGGFSTLRNLAGITADSIPDHKLSLETVFTTYAPAPPTAAPIASGQLDEVDYGSDEEPTFLGSAQAAKVPALGILSLCMLKQVVEDHEEDIDESGPMPTFVQADVDIALDEEAAQPAKIRGLRAVHQVGGDAREVPLDFAMPLLRTCDSALIVSSADAVAAASAVMAALADEEDAGLMAEHLGLLKPGTLMDALSQIVAASKRQRFLVCHPNSKVFITHNGHFNVTDDGARRLLLLSWVTPLLVRHDNVSEIKVKRVSREAVELSSEFKRKVILNRTMQLPESVVALMKEVSARLGALEAAAKAAPPAPPAVPATPAPSPPSPPSASAAGKSFKRVLDMLGGGST